MEHHQRWPCSTWDCCTLKGSTNFRLACRDKRTDVWSEQLFPPQLLLILQIAEDMAILLTLFCRYPTFFSLPWLPFLLFALWRLSVMDKNSTVWRNTLELIASVCQLICKRRRHCFVNIYNVGPQSPCGVRNRVMPGWSGQCNYACMRFFAEY